MTRRQFSLAALVLCVRSLRLAEPLHCDMNRYEAGAGPAAAVSDDLLVIVRGTADTMELASRCSRAAVS